MPTSISRDTWIEIMRYFAISLTDDEQSEIKVKRRLLLSLALTTRDLVDIALDELWKSMTTLEPIVQVINPTSTRTKSRETDARLTFNNNYWEIGLSLSLRAEEIYPRIFAYLSRIHYLQFATFPSLREYTLWHALSAFGQSMNLPVPRLRALSLNTGGVGPTSAYSIIPILSPNLRTLTLHDQSMGSGGEIVSAILLDILKHRSITVSKIEYKGLTSSRIACRILGFPALRSTVIPTQAKGTGITDTQLNFFQGKASLKKLDIHLSLFAVPQHARDWMNSLISLSDVTLRGTLHNILRVLQSTPIAAISSLGLYIERDTPRPQDIVQVIQSINTYFPYLHNLHLHNSAYITPLTLTDILVLRGKPLQTLVLHRCLDLSPGSEKNDLISTITVWPKLQRLYIVTYNDSVLADPKVVLPYYARHATFLHEATLPLQLAPLSESLYTGFDGNVCPLQTLGVQTITQSFNTQGVLEVAQNILALFPRLTTITSPENNTPQALQDLQATIKIFRRLLASPPRRADCLYL
ncbi:hypothetical protein AN958_00394 [Leucoagaricus sp. SymC.cos]|nr:hypothetical protein AN958_00394 [Leucoagaricus sp. SymC.cos]